MLCCYDNVKTCAVLLQSGSIFAIDYSLLQNVKKFHQEFNKTKPIFLKEVAYIQKIIWLKYCINKKYSRNLPIKWF